MSAPKAADRERLGLPKLVRDLRGLRVRTRRAIATGRAVYPEGATAIVDSATSWSRITLKGDPCPCCQIQLLVSRVHWSDIEVVGQ
jgi:hypothetical protein